MNPADDSTRFPERILREAGAPLEIGHAESAGLPFGIARLSKRSGPAAGEAARRGVGRPVAARRQLEEATTGGANG